MMTDLNIKLSPSKPKLYYLDEVHSAGSTRPSWRLTTRSHVWRPPTDVYEYEDTLVVRVEVAGMREEDFTISLSGKLLTVAGIRPDIPERRAYHQMEIFFGEFLSEVELPCAVVAEQVNAEYIMGFLRIKLPKSRPHKIVVED